MEQSTSDRGVYFEWDTIARVYNGDLFRAKQGFSRRVPGLRYSYVIRDTWTCLNVLNYAGSCCSFPSFLGLSVTYYPFVQQPYMLTAIKEMAKYEDEVTRSSHLETAEYLEACNK